MTSILKFSTLMFGGSNHEVALEVVGVLRRNGSTSCWHRAIPLTSRRSTWRLFRGARAVRKQLAATDGVIGFSLLARPLRKQYATLSVLTGEDALARFAGADPHRGLVRELTPEMGSTRFVRWTIRGADGKPSWADALRRLG